MKQQSSKSSRLWCILLSAIVNWAISQSAAAFDPTANLQFITENYPPYNYLDNDRLTGISVDLLDQIFIKLGSDKTRKDVSVHPWARGYRTILTVPNTVLFVMTRNPKREGLFRWVGPVTSTPIVLLARKDRGLKFATLEEVHKGTIVAIGSDIGDLILDTYHVPMQNRQTVPYPDIAAKMLISNRIDMWAYGYTAAMWLLKQEGVKTSDFEVVWDFGSAGDNYYAFHRDTPDAVINQFQEALDALKEDDVGGGVSTYQSILNSYLR